MQVFSLKRAVRTIMLFLVVSLVICSSLANPISNENPNQKIIGAAGAYLGQFPYQASLRYNYNGNHFCGGSIISEEWILTSARCILGKTASSIRVVVGSIYLNVGGVSHNVLLLNPHSEYNPSLNLNDIGLIRINGRISLTANVRPLKFYHSNVLTQKLFRAERVVKATMLFLVLSLVICSSLANPINNETNQNDERLIGAAAAYVGQFPYQVSLRFSANSAHFCGGSIISDEWVLTSARCIIQKTASSISVVVGSIYLNVGGVSYSVLILIPHSEYNPNLNVNDVGLIRINGRISLTADVRPVSLSNDPSSVGLPLTVSGWGLSNYPSNNYPNTLQWITLTSINNQACQQRLPGYQIYDTHICSDGRVGQGICEGDYGSPLVFANQQHGISSWAIPCGVGFPDLYSRVSTFREWIRAISNV